MDSNARSDLRVLVRLFPGHDGQSDNRVLQQPRDRPARDLPADFCRGYRGPKITCSIEAADTTPIGAPFGLVSSGFMYAVTGSEKNRLTRWKTDPRKASAKKAGDRVGAHNRIRLTVCDGGPCCSCAA